MTVSLAVLGSGRLVVVPEEEDSDYPRHVPVGTLPGVASFVDETRIGSAVLKGVREAGLALGGRDRASASLYELEHLVA